jgi:hypothetical protein
MNGNIIDLAVPFEERTRILKSWFKIWIKII